MSTKTIVKPMDIQRKENESYLSGNIKDQMHQYFFVQFIIYLLDANVQIFLSR